MPLKIRTYHELTEADRSGLPEQIAEQRKRLADRLSGVRRLIVVMSGKGGVGKSHVTVELARALSRTGAAIGVLDADLNGPTVARLLDTVGRRLVEGEHGLEPVVGLDGVRCLSMAHLLAEGQPLTFRGPEHETFVWRGALETTVLRELLGDVHWGALDALLVDLPPGVERFNEMVDLLGVPPTVLTVTIPTAESGDAVRRALRAAADHGSALLGIVENMTGGPFSGSAGRMLANEFRIPLLAQIPFHPTSAAWDALAAHSAFRDPHPALK
jgi:ATP-binding protein involved in chromosome partitioning